MQAQRKLVSFIGIGSQSAASLLYSYIRLHPKVCAPEIDTEFFSNTKVYSQGIIWYESQFDHCPKGGVCGELAFNYLSSAPSVSLITRTYPSAKLIAVIENPLLSVRTSYVEARYNKTVSPKVSLAMYLKQNPEVLTRARYGKQLAEYFSFYSPTDLLVVVASDLKDETLATLASVYDHIGVDKNFIPKSLLYLVPPDEDEIKYKPGIIKRIYRFIKKIIKLPFKLVNQWLHPPQVPVDTAAMVASQLALGADLENYLKSYYRNDVNMLSHLVHRNLSLEWGFEDGDESK